MVLWIAGCSALVPIDEAPSVEPTSVAPAAVEEPQEPALPAGCVSKASELPASDRFDPTDPAPWKASAVIAVRKEARKILLFDQGELATLDDGSPACWSIGLGQDYPAGHKQVQGDMKTPEGWYPTSDRPWSAFYHAITVHYPDDGDADAALAAGRISKNQNAEIKRLNARGQLPLMNTKLGGQILIHGGGGTSDWTLGCVAMDDPDIDGLRARLPEGMRTRVVILP